MGHPVNTNAQERSFATFQCSVHNCKCSSIITWRIGNITSGVVKNKTEDQPPPPCNDNDEKKRSTFTLLTSMDMSGTPVQCVEMKSYKCNKNKQIVYKAPIFFHSKFAVLVVTAQEGEYYSL